MAGARLSSTDCLRSQSAPWRAAASHLRVATREDKAQLALQAAETPESLGLLQRKRFHSTIHSSTPVHTQMAEQLWGLHAEDVIQP